MKTFVDKNIRIGYTLRMFTFENDTRLGLTTAKIKIGSRSGMILQLEHFLETLYLTTEKISIFD